MHQHRPRVLFASLKVLAVFGVVGILLLGLTAPRVEAGIGGSDTPTFQTAVTVGTTINANLTVINLSTAPNDSENVNLVSLFLTPSCKVTSGGGVCPPGAEDPGVFSVLTANGAAGTPPCAGVNFAIGGPDPATGEVTLTPASTITLGPATGLEPARTCTVNLTLKVLKVPSNPANPPCTGGGPICTDPVTNVSLIGVTSQLNGGGSGSAQLTVNPATPTVATTSNPNTSGLPLGTSVSDSVTVTGAAGAVTPTGTVTFFLCSPAQVTAGQGCVSGGSQVGAVKTLNASGQATSDVTSNTNAAGTYCWRAQYSGDASYAAASHTDFTGECFSITAPPPTLSTQPTPGTGTVLQTALSDVAILGGGNNLTGTITFSLFGPGDPSCSGNPIFTSQVTVNGAGSYQSGSFPASSVTAAGTYHWRAHYSGDANNDPLDTECSAEPVTISPAAVPTLSEWGMILFVMILVGIGSLMLGRRRNVQAG